MGIVRDRAKRSAGILDDSCPSSLDLSAAGRRFTLVDSASAGGIETVQNVTGQGANFIGVLVNTPNTGEQAYIRVLGIEEIRAASAITAGDEVTASGVTGTIETAAGADYVAGTAREDGVTAQCVSIRLRKYQKNA